MTAHRCIRPAAGIRWVVEASAIYVVDIDNGRAMAVAYPEAALWDLICRNRPAAAVFAALAGLEEGEAGQLITIICNRWLDEGWLELAP